MLIWSGIKDPHCRTSKKDWNPASQTARMIIIIALVNKGSRDT